MIKITDLKIPLEYDIDLLAETAAQMLGIGRERIRSLEIVRRSVDVHDKNDVHFKITIHVKVNGSEEELVYSLKKKQVTLEAESSYIVPAMCRLTERPIVVGCGPAGMFAALTLAIAGARPILLERGDDVDSRKKSVLNFWHTGILDTCSNVQFGEGGAGAFSDGKLKIGFKDARKLYILKEFVNAGAPPEIMYVEKPHIGTDYLHDVVKRIREKTIGLGGEVRFNAVVTRILLKDDKAAGVGFMENGTYEELYSDNIILAIGHSARDTFENLLDCGIHIEQKPFSIGVRIEHPQRLIDNLVYGRFAGHPSLGAADYRLTVHLKNGRGVYTFCMCPGGEVVAAASEKDQLVTNGMSQYARAGVNANTALLVTLGKSDIKSEHPLAGVEFQRKIEKEAFMAGGGGYKAPVQRLEDFIRGVDTKAFGDVIPTYLPGTNFAEVDSYLPDYVADSLRQAVYEMDDWMPGFAYPDAVLTGAETRSGAPVKISRDENFQALGIKGLYPCGEGAGYSGGIISAAVDGVICAEHILGKAIAM